MPELEIFAQRVLIFLLIVNPK